MYFAGYKENDILNKILFILLIVFFMVLIFVSPSFADSDTNSNTFVFHNPVTNKDETVVKPSGLPADFTYSLVIIAGDLRGEDGDYVVNFLFSNTLVFIDTSSPNTGWGIEFSSGEGLGVYHCSLVSRAFNNYNLSNNMNYFNFYKNGFSSTALHSTPSVPLSVAYANYDVKEINTNEVLYAGAPKILPYFMTVKENLETGKFDTLDINAGYLSGLNDKFGLFIYDITSKHFDGIFSSVSDLAKDVTPVSYMVLDGSSPYRVMMDTDAIYTIPRDKLGINLENGKRYQFALINLDDASVYNRVNFTVGGLTAEEELKNKQDETNKKLEDQTNAIKESNETNKNIFERIGEMLSYINPFSENFFVYKLIELLVDAIKSLFIPSDDFFGNYFTELKDWFSERLGFLFYPFQLIIDILNKILNINFSEPIFNIPDLIEPFTGSKIMSATTFNLNSMIESGIFKTIHDIYLVCVDAFITFELVNLFKRKYEEVTTK